MIEPGLKLGSRFVCFTAHHRVSQYDRAWAQDLYVSLLIIVQYDRAWAHHRVSQYDRAWAQGLYVSLLIIELVNMIEPGLKVCMFHCSS